MTRQIQVQNAEVIQGNRIRIRCKVTVDGKPNSQAEPITGATIRYAIAESSTTAAIVTKTSTAGQITLPGGGGDGEFEVILEVGDTASLAGDYHHEADVNFGSGPETVFVGVLTVLTSSLN